MEREREKERERGIARDSEGGTQEERKRTVKSGISLIIGTQYYLKNVLYGFSCVNYPS